MLAAHPLTTHPAATKRPPIVKWLWALGVVFLGVVAGFTILLATHWPFTREAITGALEAASGRKVQIRTFSRTYFPPGCIAEGIHFLRHKHPEAEPVIQVEKLVIQGSLTGMFSSPKRLAAVRIFGMHMRIPPKTGAAEGSVPLNSGPGGKLLAISEITTDGALLEFLPEESGGEPYRLKIDHLRITNVGAGAPMSYRATLTNTEPPGVIKSEGKFGPWNPVDEGATAVSGSYTYDGIDLSAFHGISGMGNASGTFSGPLGRIHTQGNITIAGFHVDGSDHSVQMATTFNATVNGANGDVFLNPAAASFRGTRVEVRGWIAARPGEKGKTAAFDIAVPKGRVDDFLLLFTTGQPGMSGNVTMTGKFAWPPGPSKFVEKIRMDLTFGTSAGRFTNPGTQDSVDRISQSAQGESNKQQDEDPRTALSEVRGDIHLRNGIASIANANFEVPRAHATVGGTYSLVDTRVDLHGMLDTHGHLSDTTSGLKAVVLKAVTPLFKKEGSMRIVPFKITGKYGNASVTIDWKKDLSSTAGSSGGR